MTTSTVQVTGLRTEYLRDPIGIDAPRPRLSWQLTATRRNVRQAAWRVQVATSPEALSGDEGDLWDSGQVEGDQISQVVYGGPPLRSRQQVWWRVRIWDDQGTASNWSEAAHWEMGLLRQTDWRGRWISLPGLQPDPSISETEELDALLPVTLLRRSFALQKSVTRATLYATARGVYVPYLNGARVGTQVLAPGWTDYNSRIQYQTYDVTGLITAGENVLGVELGTGWFAGYVGWQQLCRHYGTTPQALMQLHLDYADGTSEVVATGRDWQGATGPIRYSDFIMGEWYDARLATDWARPGFDAAGWEPVQDSAVSAVPLVADCSEPVRAMEAITPVAITETGPGSFIVDLGQNIAGWVQLRAEGPSGTRITLRHAEILNPDGSLYTTNLRSARATDTIILAGNGIESFEPSFTWHGFRYVEVTGYPGQLTANAITGRFVGSDTEPAGTFKCSDDFVNVLQDNIVRGQRGNFLSIPTDCPQRDERLGWLGDAQVFIGTAVGNMQLAAFFTKWMRDVVDAQDPAGAFPDVAPRVVDLATGAPAWADAGVIVPWTLWRTYGDTRVIDEHWSAMERWLAWLENGNPDFLWRHDRGNDFGDWLSIEADTPKELIGTAYWAWDARLMAEMATATDRHDAASRYRHLHEQVVSAFRNAYLLPDGSLHGGTQTTYCLALHFGLLNDQQAARAVELLVADIEAKGNHLSTGFVGVSYLCHVLTAHGRPDMAYRLLHQESFPSWKYSILHGATTIWERWDGWTEERGFQDPGMNSFNHYSLGSVGEWLRRSVAGIDQQPDTIGHRSLRLAPCLNESLDWAEATYHSLAGQIRSRWERNPAGLQFSVTVPPNTQADVVLPAGEGATILEGEGEIQDAPDLQIITQTANSTTMTIGSGSWNFTIRAS